MQKMTTKCIPVPNLQRMVVSGQLHEKVVLKREGIPSSRSVVKMLLLVNAVVNSTVWSVSCWASCSVDFDGVSMTVLNLSWSAFSKVG